jgi:hypothetical protein
MPRFDRSLLTCLVLALAVPARAQEASPGPEQPADDPAGPPEASPPAEASSAGEPPLEAAAAAAARPPTCIGAVHAAARASIVRVESGLAVGAGFLALDAAHVVTSRSIVADGHGVRVVDVEGNARAARVVVTAPDDDLALLELASPLPGAPLEVADPAALDVGREVVVPSFALGATRRGRDGRHDFEFSLTAGALNALGERAVQVDARPAIVGAPIVDCHGEVVGVARRGFFMTTDDFTFGSGAGAVADLVSRVGAPETHGGRVDLFLGLGLSAAFEDQPPEREPDLLGGAYLQLGVTALDAFVLAARGHFLSGGTDPTGSSVLRREGRRFRVDAYLGWRQLVQLGPGMGLHFELSIGASATLHRDQSRALVSTAGGFSFVDTVTERWRVRPLVMATLELGMVQLGYQVELELEDRGRLDAGGGHLYHLMSLGARF